MRQVTPIGVEAVVRAPHYRGRLLGRRVASASQPPRTGSSRHGWIVQRRSFSAGCAGFATARGYGASPFLPYCSPMARYRPLAAESSQDGSVKAATSTFEE